MQKKNRDSPREVKEPRKIHPRFLAHKAPCHSGALTTHISAMVKREKARIRVPAFESWFPICETLSKSLYLSEPHFSHLQTGMMLVPTHRKLQVNEMVYRKYLEQCLKHRIRSIYTGHSCCYHCLHFAGASVLSHRFSARLSGGRSCPLYYCYLQVALTEEATEFCIPSFLFFRSPCAHTKSHLQVIAFHLPPLPQGLWGKKGRVQPRK